jgi:hypothetical protein
MIADTRMQGIIMEPQMNRVSGVDGPMVSDSINPHAHEVNLPIFQSLDKLSIISSIAAIP